MEKKKEMTAQKLMVSDRQVYRTYFGSIGPTHMTLFLVFGVIFAFTLRFPGTPKSNPI